MDTLKSDSATDEQVKRLDTLLARFQEIKNALESMPKHVLDQEDIAKG